MEAQCVSHRLAVYPLKSESLHCFDSALYQKLDLTSLMISHTSGCEPYFLNCFFMQCLVCVALNLCERKNSSILNMIKNRLMGWFYITALHPTALVECIVYPVFIVLMSRLRLFSTVSGYNTWAIRSKTLHSHYEWTMIQLLFERRLLGWWKNVPYLKEPLFFVSVGIKLFLVYNSK